MNSFFDGFDAWLLALILALAMLAAWGAGWRMGSRLGARDGELIRFKFAGASLAFLTLLLAFAFGMSMIKHERRKETVAADSNAIKNFYTCVSLLEDPLRTKLQALIHEYTALRLEVAGQQSDRETFESALRRFQQMHSQMTDLVAEAVSNRAPLAAPLTNTLNEVKSGYAACLAAVRERLPDSIMLLLFTSAVVATMLLGREQAAQGRMQVASTLSFILVVTLAVCQASCENPPSDII